MQRCDYCGRVLYKNVSEKYFLCSSKCRTKYKNKKYLSKLEQSVTSVVKNGILVKEIVNKLDYDKFDTVSAIRRLIYKKGSLFIKANSEINLNVEIFIVRK